MEFQETHMKSILKISLSFYLATASIWGSESSIDTAGNWPQWRGPDANGVATKSDPPVSWSETENIKWKVELPGKGSSSPIVWGKYVFVTSAVPTGKTPENPKPASTEGRGRSVPVSEQKFVVIALNREDGSILWQKSVRQEVPHEGTHPTGTWASNSAVTDGQHIYAYFGSRGLYCLDFDGNLIWEKDFGEMTKIRAFGEGSSPALHADRVFVLWDHEGPSFLFALDKMTGNEIWKKSRDEGTSWSTPLVVETESGKQVITSATNRARSYSFADGSLIWECGGLTRNVIPSPVAEDGIVFLMSGFRGNALFAVRLADAQGNVDGTESILWTASQDTPYAPSPLLYNEILYFLKSNNGILSAFGAKTGERFYGPQRLEGIGNVYSSPVGAAGRVYISDREGKTLVIRHGPEFEILASNALDDGFDASPAIVADQIFMRGHQSLYCIARK